MLAVVVFYVFLLFIFGRDGIETWLAQGQDSATQSENAMNHGASRASGAIGVLDAMVQTRLSQRMTNLLRTALFNRMARLPMTTLDDHRIGDSVYRVMYDAPQVPGMCYRVTIEPVFSILAAAVALYLMNYSYGAVAPELIWIASAMIPIALVVTLPLSTLTRRVNQDSRAAGTATTNAIEQSIGNVAAVQSLGGMVQERQRVDTKSAESFRRFRHVRIVQLALEYTSIGAVVAMVFYACIFITDQIIDGVMSPGDFTVLFGLSITLGGAAINVGMFWIEIQSNAAAVRRVFFFIDEPGEDSGGTAVVPPFHESVQIRNVDYSYPDGRQALHDVTLDRTPARWSPSSAPLAPAKRALRI